MIRIRSVTTCFIVPAAAALTALAGCSYDSIRAEREVSITTAHVDDAPVQIDSRNGRIEIIVESGADEVVVDAVLYCGGSTLEEAQARVDASRIEVSRDTSRTLYVKPIFDGGPRSNDGARFTVHVPDVNGVRATTGNGGIAVRGSRGDLIARTSNGSITVKGHDGPSDVDTSNGRIEMTAMNGSVEGHTSNGKIAVQLAPSVPGPVHLTTSNGSITLTVGADFAGEVSMSTSNGKVRLDDAAGIITHSVIDRRHGSARFGDGPDSKLKSSNGSITLSTASAP